MKRRLLAACITAMLAVGLLAGCGDTGAGGSAGNGNDAGAEKDAGSDADAGTDAADAGSAGNDGTEAAKADDGEPAAPAADVDLKEITIAVPFADSGSMWMNQMSYNLNNKLGPVANAKIVYQASTFDADGVLSFVESEIAAGVDGLMFCPPSNSVLPTICSLCDEAQVYWAISMRSINDEEIKAMCEASPYYVGNCYEDEVNTGYLVGKYLGESGAKKIAIISTTKGDTTGDAREVGLAKACEEFDIEIVGEARGLAQASDVTNAVESFLSANADLDAVFCVGTTVTGVQEISVKAVQDSGREDVKVVCIDHPEGITALFETGILTYSVGTPSFALDMYVCGIKLVNAVQGTPISGSLEGKSTNSVDMAEIRTVEEAKAYEEAGSNPEYVFFEEDELQQMMGWNNPDFDESALQELLSNYEL